MGRASPRCGGLGPGALRQLSPRVASHRWTQWTFPSKNARCGEGFSSASMSGLTYEHTALLRFARSVLPTAVAARLATWEDVVRPAALLALTELCLSRAGRPVQVRTGALQLTALF